MNFLLCGKKDARPVLLIHGLAETAELCYSETAKKLCRKYRVILACLDGHDPRSDSLFESIEHCAEKIERYIQKRFDGSVYAVSGFSLGGTVALELMKRGNIKTEKLLLDAALSKSTGLMKIPNKLALTKGIDFMKHGHKLPNILLEKSPLDMNSSTCPMLYTDISPETIENACSEAYGYKPSPLLKNCGAEVQFWCGSQEKASKNTARMLEQYLPDMKVRVFKGFKHGEMLHERRRAYLRELCRFLRDK